MTQSSDNNNFLDVSELDFLEIRDNVKAYLSGQKVFKDYDFDGSNMSILLDILAWNTHLNAHYLNMVGTEMWMDTARLEDSVVSHAKELNYIPRSRKSSKAVAVLTINTGNNNPDSITIPKWYGIQAKGLDFQGLETKYTFITDGPVTVKKNAFGNYVSPEIDFYEGTGVREIFVTSNSQKYVLRSKDVDTSSIKIGVRPSGSSTANIQYSYAESTYGLDETSTIFFVQGAYDGRYEVTFGDGNLGKKLNNGDVVNVEYRVSSGIYPNGSSRFTPTSSVEQYEISSVTTVTRANGGLEREDLESIRNNAPKYFATQSRAVTNEDYKTLVKTKFAINDVTVYGGEEIVPKRYGKVIISCKPSGAEVLSNLQKEDIITYLSQKNMVTEPIIVDAEFLYIEIDTNAYFNGNQSRDNDEQMKTKVFDAIKAFLDNSNSTGFGTELKYSRLVRAIDDADIYINSNDTEVKLIKRWKPVTGSKQPLVFSFNNKLKDAVRLSNKVNNDPIVYSSGFKYLKNNAKYDVIMQDDGAGTLFLYSLQSNGSRVIVEPSVGTVDYSSGKVKASLNVFSYDAFVEIRALCENKDIKVKANLFMTYTDEYLNINVTRE